MLQMPQVKKLFIMLLVMVLLFPSNGITSQTNVNSRTVFGNKDSAIVWLEFDKMAGDIWFYNNVDRITVGYPDGASFQGSNGGIQVPVGTTITVRTKLNQATDNMSLTYDVSTGFTNSLYMSDAYDFVNKKFVKLPRYDGEDYEPRDPNLNYEFNSKTTDAYTITFDQEGLYTLNFSMMTSSGDIGGGSWSTMIVNVGNYFSTDVPSTWAAEAARSVINNSNGESIQWYMGDEFFGNFRSNITRLEFAKLAMALFRTLNGPYASEEGEPFSDCSDYAVIEARAHGLIGGYPDGSYKPNNVMKRSEIAYLLVNVMEKAGMTITPASSNPFNDLATSHWAYSSIVKAQANGVVAGIGHGKFDPDGSATREQALIMFQNIFKKYEASFD